MARKGKSGSAPPNLPQHNLPPPYARLMQIGLDNVEDVDEEYRRIAAELKRGDARAAVAQLIQIALDETYYQYWSERNQDDPRLMTRTNAVGTLAHMGDAAQAAMEPLLPLLTEEDDWLREETPLFYGAMGQPALPLLAKALLDTKGDELRYGAADALTEIGEKHPETKSAIIPLLEKVVQEEKEDDALVGHAIGSLMDLGAKDSLPIIEQAFLEQRVDEFLIQLPDVEQHFGLPPSGPRKTWRELSPELADVLGDEEDEDEEDEAAVTFDAPLLSPLAPTAASEEENTPQVPFVNVHKAGRNDPCPCGSGKKYKKCCGA